MTEPTQTLPTSVRARNYRLVQIDSLFVGTLTASYVFLPVFLVRLGGSGTEVGLLSAISAVGAVALAIPSGRWLQRRSDIVWWYSRLRLVSWMAYLFMGLAGVLLPAAMAVPAILLIWALSAIPGTAGMVAFPIVMDGVAGPSGRFDLLGRRWSIASVATTIAAAAAGQFLEFAPFPTNFGWLMAAFSLAGFGSFVISTRFVIPPPVRPAPPSVLRDDRRGSRAPAPVAEAVRGVRELVRLVGSRRSFVTFEFRSLFYTAAFGLTMPLMPLFYVREVGAPDAWIGVIGAGGSIGSVVGYIVARRISKGRDGTSVLIPSMLAAALAPALLALVGWLPAVAALAALGGLAAAGAQLALFDQLMARIPREHNVTFVSVDQTLQNAALIVAPSLGGILAITIGVRWGLVVSAVVGLVAVVLFALDRRATRPA